MPSTGGTTREYERRAGPWVDSPWRPLDPEAMRMSPLGLRRFRQFSRLLNDGKAHWFDFTRYQPQIGVRMSTDTATLVRLKRSTQPATTEHNDQPRG